MLNTTKYYIFNSDYKINHCKIYLKSKKCVLYTHRIAAWSVKPAWCLFFLCSFNGTSLVQLL